MPTIPPAVAKVLHVAAVVVFLISGLGATLTSFKAIFPPEWLANGMNVVVVCQGIVLYMLSSPILKGFLPIQTPVAALGAAEDRLVASTRTPSTKGTP